MAINGHRLVQHGGEWQGFSTHISRFLDKKLTVIVLSNLAAVRTNALLWAGLSLKL